jgi:hypothetical protein
MAGDWIKMRMDLRTHPKVVRIASALKADRLRVIGGLHAVWCLFDAHSADGRLDGYTVETLDEDIAWPGFSAAMVAVEWLENDGVSLCTPRFDEHNGQSAKRRAQEAERKRNDRKKSAESSASGADKKRTREEKRREEIKNPPIPPEGATGRARSITFPEFMKRCKEAGETPIPNEHPVFAYASQAGIPDEFLSLHWLEFKDRYSDGKKKYTEWRTVFSKSVRGNWFHLWYAAKDGSGFHLTTDGVQAQNVHRDKK